MKHMNREASFSQFLTITSPLASKRECKANSELVPPPGNALEQHKFRRFSTVGNKERPLHQKELRVTGKTNRSIPKPRGHCVLLPLWSTPCGSSSGCTDLTAARAGLVPSSSSWHTQEGQAQTDKCPTATSQPTQLPHHLRPRGLESTSGAEDRMGAICY